MARFDTSLTVSTVPALTARAFPAGLATAGGSWATRLPRDWIWKSASSLPKPTSSWPATTSMLMKPATARSAATGIGVPVADVIDERLRDLGLPTNQLRTGHDEIHSDAGVEGELLSDQRRQLQRLCLRHERDRRRLGHGGGYLCLHGCHHDDGGGGRCEAR